MRFPMIAAGCVTTGFFAACNPSPSNGDAVITPGPLSVFTVTWVRAEKIEGFVHLTAGTVVKNPGSNPCTLSSPALQLFAGKKKVPPFIAPGLEPAVISPGGEAEVATHWWVGAEDLSGPLTLEMGGERVEVKSASAFALDLLPEKKAVSLSFPDWQIR